MQDLRLYIKVGVNSEEDLEVVKTVREAIDPQYKPRIDPNETWYVGTAVRWFLRLEKCDPELSENPIPHQYLAGVRK